jgi:hypothetical protein
VATVVVANGVANRDMDMATAGPGNGLAAVSGATVMATAVDPVATRGSKKGSAAAHSA